MNDIKAMADHFEIEALRGEFTDAVMMRDPDRLAMLFTEDGVWRMPNIPVELIGREQIRAGERRLQEQWDYFIQTTHPGTIQLLGDTAVGRAYLCELVRLRDGHSEVNYAVYHDRYQRTEEGWKFVERVYEVRYLDHTPLAGSVPQAVGAQAQASHDQESQSEVRALLESRVEACRAKDIDRLMALYAPDSIYFDAVPPLQFVGSAAIRRNFLRWFDEYEGPICLETHDLQIVTSGDIAFAHLLHLDSGNRKYGNEAGIWLRATVCCQRSNNRWVITHEHISLPFDPQSGRVVLDLVP